MRIPNKFNGYSADNIRLYNDPATLTAIAAGSTGTATMAGVAAPLVTAAPTLAAVAPVATSAGLGILPEATSILPQTLGGTAQAAIPVADASAKALATEAGLAQGVGDTTAQLTSQINAVNSGAAPGTPIPTPGTAAPGTPMPNVPTVPNPAYAPPNPAYEASATAARAQIPPTVGGPESSGIMDQFKNLIDPLTSGFDKAMNYAKENPKTTAAGLYALSKMTERKPSGGGEKYAGSSFDHEGFNAPMMNPYLYGANGGIMSSYADGGMTGGGPVEQMSRQNAVGANTQYPMADQQTYGYTPQRPISQNMIDPQGEQNLDPYTGMPKFAKGGMADFQKMLAEQEEDRKEKGMRSLREHTPDVSSKGIIRRPLSEETSDPYTAAVARLKKASQVAGIKMYEMPKLNMPESFSSVEAASGGIMRGDLGGYSDGGRLLKGPGDGVSDSIPAVIGNKQPARLADGEFVVPARIVSELGNGSTEAGARKLYAMMERIQKGRRKSVGKGKVAVNSKADKHLPA